MILYRLRGDDCDDGNSLTQHYETVCRCERCSQMFSADSEIESTDLCPECEEKLNKVQEDLER